MSRTKRRKFRGSKRFDKTCRNHGACSWCSRGRQHRHKRAMPAPDKGETLYGVEDNYNSASQDEDLNLHESNYCPVRTAQKQVADSNREIFSALIEINKAQAILNGMRPPKPSILKRIINYLKSCLTT